MKPLYLDVKDISGLARTETEHGSRLVSSLRGGDFALAFSLVHLHELSHPSFRSMKEVGRLLDSVPLAWATHVDVLWDLECKRILSSGPKRRLPSEKVFFPDAATGWSMPLNAMIPPSQMLTELSVKPEIRKHLVRLADRGTLMRERVGTAAAVVHDLIGPAAARLTERTKEWGKPVTQQTARHLLDGGGLETCMPSYLAFSLLNRTRAADPMYPNEANDILDELHAAYVPYVAGAVLDRRTAGRFGSAKCPGYEHTFRNVAGLVEHLGC